MSELTSMKDILVSAGGGSSDHAVFAAALGIAQPLGAHLEFFHVCCIMATACRVRAMLGYAGDDAAA